MTEQKTSWMSTLHPRKNIPSERQVFREVDQAQGELMNGFGSRLDKLVFTSEFGDNKDDFIQDQVIDKCRSNMLCRWLLCEDLTLAGLQEIAEQQRQQINKLQRWRN